MRTSNFAAQHYVDHPIIFRRFFDEILMNDDRKCAIQSKTKYPQTFSIRLNGEMQRKSFDQRNIYMLVDKINNWKVNH